MLPAKQPLEKTPATSSLQERIRQSLEDELRSGAMQPGDAIDEPALCERFGASRTPVREALLLLVAKGLVEIVPRSGIYVRRLDARELVAMMEGLAELEGVLARLAATRIHAQLRERLQAALAHTAACAQAQDAQGYVQANMQLHELIYEASGNDFIVEQVSRAPACSLAVFALLRRAARSAAEIPSTVDRIARFSAALLNALMSSRSLATISSVSAVAMIDLPGGY